MGNTTISFSPQNIQVYLQLISEGVWILRARNNVGGSQRLLTLLSISQLGQHRLQAGLEGVNLLQTQNQSPSDIHTDEISTVYTLHDD